MRYVLLHSIIGLISSHPPFGWAATEAGTAPRSGEVAEEVPAGVAGGPTEVGTAPHSRVVASGPQKHQFGVSQETLFPNMRAIRRRASKLVLLWSRREQGRRHDG